jgi:putative N-acetyltransferase (TIGR04045 family)
VEQTVHTGYCGHETSPDLLLLEESRVAVATTPWELENYYRVRSQVFVMEQGIYSLTDRDQYDEHAIPIIAVMNGQVAGVVRCYRKSDRFWYGGRLAVLPEFRIYNFGALLVRKAVDIMINHPDVERFMATVQIQNVRFFKRLGWTSIGRPIVLKGFKHQVMEYPLEDNRSTES